MTNITVNLEPELEDHIGRIAKAMERPQSWVIQRALETFVADQAWQIAEIEKGLAEADADDFASAEEIAAAFAKWPREG